MTRVKICGLGDVATARAACAAGADAIGLVFYGPSPRAVSIEEASAIIAAVEPLVSVVGLFVNPSAQEVEAVLEACPLDCLQFHGDEDATFCERFRRPYLRAVSMKPDVDVAALIDAHPRARGFLLDAWREDAPGGTGETFDWNRVPAIGRPWVLAGGLTPSNVGDAIRRVRPDAVDVSGGVEETRGVKSARRIEEFMRAVARADEAGTAGPN